MANGTKEALADALRQMMKVKPIDKITVKDIVEVCGVNRQTFYYHFDDVDDLLEWVFEDDAERVLPKEVVYEHWLEDVMTFMDYLEKNSDFTLNVYNSNSRLYMLRYLKAKMKACIESFAVIVSEGKNIERQDFEFITEFYASGEHHQPLCRTDETRISGSGAAGERKGFPAGFGKGEGQK